MKYAVRICLILVCLASSARSDRVPASPSVTLTKWGGEARLTVSYHIPNARESHSSRMTVWRGELEDLVVYRQSNITEIGVVLHTLPALNEFVFFLSGHEDMRFLPQPLESRPGLHQPENVIDSIAIYHSTKRDHVIGQRNYSTGKLWHLYRIRAWDSRGDSVYGHVRVDSNRLIVTVPPAWLASASYPVFVDPTFGDISIGGTTLTIEDIARLAKAAPSTSGTLDSITAFIEVTTAAKNAQAAIYDYTSDTDAGALLANSAASVSVNTGSSQEINFPSIVTALTGSTNYFIGVQMASGAGTGVLYRDNSGGNGLNATVSFPAWANPFSETASSNDLYSVYGTYSEGGACGRLSLLGVGC